MCHPEDVSNFHVGMPVLCAELKLEDVAEMGYASAKSPPSGEVCVRGPCVFMGYYKMPDKTKEAIDEDGWFHTGDIGCWTETGCLRIVDRKKNIFKLAQGEYVAAEKIETVMMRCPLVAQIFVYGDSLQAYLVGVVVPEAEEVASWAKQEGLSVTKLAEVVKSAEAGPKLKAAIYAQITAAAKAAKLAGFEMVKKLHVEPELWTVDNGLLTPTFKSKRPDLKKHYQAQLDAMYAEGIAPGKSKL
jgi:long-chain acyl-CoA synthetase